MSREPHPIRAGNIVEVWNRPLGQFRGPYRVADTSPTGIHVQPMTEPTPLPSTYSVDEVRLLPRTRRPRG